MKIQERISTHCPRSAGVSPPVHPGNLPHAIVPIRADSPTAVHRNQPAPPHHLLRPININHRLIRRHRHQPGKFRPARAPRQQQHTCHKNNRFHTHKNFSVFNISSTLVLAQSFFGLRWQSAASTPLCCARKPLAAPLLGALQNFTSALFVIPFNVRRSTFDVRRSMFPASAFLIGCWMFDVDCWMFPAPPPLPSPPPNIQHQSQTPKISPPHNSSPPPPNVQFPKTDPSPPAPVPPRAT